MAVTTTLWSVLSGERGYDDGISSPVLEKGKSLRLAKYYGQTKKQRNHLIMIGCQFLSKKNTKDPWEYIGRVIKVIPENDYYLLVIEETKETGTIYKNKNEFMEKHKYKLLDSFERMHGIIP